MSICEIRQNGELRLAQYLLPDCRVVFDVGSREDDDLVKLNPRCQFHLFEPMQDSFESLRRKVQPHGNVVANCLALGDRNGRCKIFPDTQSICHRPHTRQAAVEIEILRLDDYCQKHEIEHIDFIKIDTEGHELAVLKGGRQIIQQATRMIQFEYGGTYQDAGITLQEVFQWLGAGWRIYRVLPQQLRRIKRFSSHLEDYQYSNYLASRHRLPARVVGSNLLTRWFSKKTAAA